MYYSLYGGKFSKEEGTIDPPKIGAWLPGKNAGHEGLANWTTYPILLLDGADTVPAGGASDIICPPMAGIIITAQASSHAQYLVVPLSDERLRDAIQFRGE